MANKVLKLTEWQSPAKHWYVADTTTWTKWWAIPRMLGLELDEYVEKLVSEYNATIVNFITYEDKRNSLLH